MTMSAAMGSGRSRMEMLPPISGPEFFVTPPPEGQYGWRPHLESLQVGMLVHVTDNVQILQRECEVFLSWPNDDADEPRVRTQLGKSGKVREVAACDNLVLLDSGIGWLPITALNGFDCPASPWLSHLERHGYVVIKGVATPHEVETARSMIWNTFEEKFQVDRNKTRTWTHLKGSNGPGIFTELGVPQSQGAWFVRGLPQAKQVFSQIWGTNDLITSMDAVMVWKPWWAYPDREKRDPHLNPWYPRTEGLHLDQNPYRKPLLDCVQGMLPLYDVTEQVGGLEVVPGSHSTEAKAELKKFFGEDPWYGDDWCPFTSPGMLTPSVPLNTPGRLIIAEAGDLILWDSRTVHGGVAGSGHPCGDECSPHLARLSVNFCMTPTAKALPEDLKFREEAFLAGLCLNHCPHKPDKDMHAGRPKRSWQPTFELDDEQQKPLLPW